jgi:hypothetical protein
MPSYFDYEWIREGDAFTYAWLDTGVSGFFVDVLMPTPHIARAGPPMGIRPLPGAYYAQRMILEWCKIGVLEFGMREIRR